jgi:hypothetical protein
MVGIWDVYAYSVPWESIKENETETNNSTIMDKFSSIKESYDRFLLTQFVGEKNQRLKLFGNDGEWSQKKEETIPFKSSKDLSKKITVIRLEKITHSPIEIKQFCGGGVNQKIGVFVIKEEYYCSFEFMGETYDYSGQSMLFCDRYGSELDVSSEKISGWHQDPNNNQILQGWKENIGDPLGKYYYIFFRFREFEEVKNDLFNNSS